MEKSTQKGSTQLPASIKDARVQTIESGSLKFSLDLASGDAVYQAAKKWAETDSNLLAVGLRGGGGGQIALDFRYDLAGKSKPTLKNTLGEIYKDFFDKELGKGALMGWDYADATAIVK